MDTTSQQPDATTPAAQHNRKKHPAPARWDAGTLLTVINGILAAVAGVYITTKSPTIILIACAAAVTVTFVALRAQRADRGPRHHPR